MYLILVTLTVCETANAHTKSQSYSYWWGEGNTLYATFAVDQRRVTQLKLSQNQSKPLESLLREHLQNSIRVSQAGRSCDSLVQGISVNDSVDMQAALSFACADEVHRVETLVRVNSFFDYSPTHLHFALIEINGGQVAQQVLTEAENHFVWLEDSDASGITWLKSGFTHVVSGIDHVLFLLALVLCLRGLKHAILCVSGFTLGHMLSLWLVASRHIQPHDAEIETLIAFTLIIVALQSVFAQGKTRKRFIGVIAMAMFALLIFNHAIVAVSLVATLLVFLLAISRLEEQQMSRFLAICTVFFGLIHGAGFAQGIESLELQSSQVFAYVLSFNIGVEIAQLVVLLASWMVFRVSIRVEQRAASDRQYGFRARLSEGIGLIVLSCGCFWYAYRFVQI